MLSRNLEKSLLRALTLASDRNHECVTLEHMLIALIEDQDAIAVFRACGVDIDKLGGELQQFLDQELGNLVVDRKEDPKPTASFQRVVQRAAIHVQSSGRQEVTGANVLVAMFSERESHALSYLQEQEMSRFDAVNYISHGIVKVPDPSEGLGAARSTIQIDNEHTRVTQWRLAPGEATGRHRHQYDYVIMPRSTGTLRLETSDGINEVKLVAGQSYFRNTGVEHDVINVSDHEFVFSVIDFKRQDPGNSQEQEPGYSEQYLDEIRARIKLSDVIGRRVRLVKKGSEYLGLCPFHTEKVPSFTVSEEKGFFHCFGCGAHGDVIGFVMRADDLSFSAAVERLANDAGLSGS